MVAIRERKRKKTLENIFTQAKYLFRQQGVKQTTMEDIAEKAEVGVGTLYNYFKSKGDLLAKLVQNNAQTMYSNVEKRLEQTPINTETLFKDISHIYISFWKTYDKPFWQDVLAHTIQINQGIDTELPQFNARVRKQVVDSILECIKSNILPQNIKVDIFAHIYIATLFAHFTYFITDAGYSIQKVEADFNDALILLISSQQNTSAESLSFRQI